jgi:tripeptide aminopeptidase
MQIQKERLLSLFSQLVSFDSPSFQEQALCNFLKKKLQSLGLHPSEDNIGTKIGGQCGNLYTKIAGTLPLPPLLFCAHMDTVEPACGKQALFHADGTITSNGSTVLGADDCSGIAAILEAVTVLKEQKLPHRPIEILFTVAEEPYCKGISQMDFSMIQAKQAYVWDLSGPVGRAAYQAPTILSFQISFTGKSAHAGFAPEDGIHAITAASTAISHMPSGRTNGVTTNIGTISGGTANNIVPDQCTFTGEIRSFSDEKAESMLENLKKISNQAAFIYGAQVKVQSEKHCTAYCTDIASPVVHRFQNACQELAFPSNLTQTFGGSDQNHLALHEISGLVVATAMNCCHTCQEYTSEQELSRAAELALTLMLSTE